MFRRILGLILVLALVLSMGACSPESQGTIYLYGESHGIPGIMDLELQLWQKYYQEQGMRHLFVEYSYFTAAYLNIWMQAEDDTILLELYADWEGTQSQTEATLDFLKAIKQTCPETIFHGTDVGHLYWLTGERYLAYLEDQGMKDSEEYQRTLESIDQGKTYYADHSNDHVYRENTMTENFIREFEALGGESIMGIYGTAHVKLESLNHTGECDSMGKQLQNHFGENVFSEDLMRKAQMEAQPQRVETLTIEGKDYEAEYFGLIPMSESYYGYCSAEYWRLVDGYEDFSSADFTGNVMGESVYPMLIQEGNAYVIQYSYSDGRTIKQYHLCDGTVVKDFLVTREIYVNTIR